VSIFFLHFDVGFHLQAVADHESRMQLIHRLSSTLIDVHSLFDHRSRSLISNRFFTRLPGMTQARQFAVRPDYRDAQ
jgi:hypothetical protein